MKEKGSPNMSARDLFGKEAQKGDAQKGDAHKNAKGGVGGSRPQLVANTPERERGSTPERERESTPHLRANTPHLPSSPSGSGSGGNANAEGAVPVSPNRGTASVAVGGGWGGSRSGGGKGGKPSALDGAPLLQPGDLAAKSPNASPVTRLPFTPE
jgi:hypothetical protein